jgi:hypothetical protein
MGLIVVRVTYEEDGEMPVGALPDSGFARIACIVDVRASETE